jgi:hypothetical protein
MRMARGRAGSGLATAPRTGSTGRFGLDIETSDGSRCPSAKLVSSMAVPSSTLRRGAGGSSSDAAVGAIARGGSSVTPPGRPALAGRTAVQAYAQSPRAARRSTSPSVPSAKAAAEPRGHPGACDQQRSAGKCQADHPTPPNPVRAPGKRRPARTSLISCLAATRVPLLVSAELPFSPGLVRLSPIHATVGDEVPA